MTGIRCLPILCPEETYQVACVKFRQNQHSYHATRVTQHPPTYALSSLTSFSVQPYHLLSLLVSQLSLVLSLLSLLLCCNLLPFPSCNCVFWVLVERNNGGGSEATIGRFLDNLHVCHGWQHDQERSF
jgi:hypothetical protein